MAEGLQRKIEDAQIEGWEIQEERNDSAVMIRRKKGTLTAHILIFLLLGWWTIGLANLLYLCYKYFVDKEKKVVRAE
ncbi:hypothetical protein QIT48_gp01 [Haloterrigena jeotgali icosahedral virus 1]|uniref:DUF8108 domain-containing protein n=2 Tax=root TaxID=1 RepID=A0AAF0PFQ8_9EURY|nr:hypothetical protein [Natrinema thermotolerans]YP_010772639.1 hypothetical protein QIT48_gp01 [Haloterrigena jeotgali icosahedral virus 1]QCC57404.1 hypothetical protein DVR14_01615 [Natrinema thermotolerans]WMT10392.1 hypothetical protein NP511_22785 [Natrinema thermotolerans]WPH65805.1 hypothetical protein HJIV1_gp14 [Haloterrigena jeotgali icosahedral virus 1]DAC85279.1 TPA_asm: hypothetical protein HJIV1gp1 [Haloterrigena jeotgali icosahedral virus 1]